MTTTRDPGPIRLEIRMLGPQSLFIQSLQTVLEIPSAERAACRDECRISYDPATDEITFILEDTRGYYACKLADLFAALSRSVSYDRPLAKCSVRINGSDPVPFTYASQIAALLNLLHLDTRSPAHLLDPLVTLLSGKQAPQV